MRFILHSSAHVVQYSIKETNVWKLFVMMWKKVHISVRELLESTILFHTRTISFLFVIVIVVAEVSFIWSAVYSIKKCKRRKKTHLKTRQFTCHFTNDWNCKHIHLFKLCFYIWLSIFSLGFFPSRFFYVTIMMGNENVCRNASVCVCFFYTCGWCAQSQRRLKLFR